MPCIDAGYGFCDFLNHKIILRKVNAKNGYWNYFRNFISYGKDLGYRTLYIIKFIISRNNYG